MNDVQLQILALFTALILFGIRALMIKNEQNKKEENELKNLK